MTANELKKYEDDLQECLLLKSYLSSEPNIYLLNSEFRPSKDLTFAFLRDFVDLGLEIYST